MINYDFQLKIQAYLDGELSAAEAAEVMDRLARDPEAQSLLAELQNTNGALAGHDSELKLPETREFFWSKIEREIARPSQSPASVPRMSWVDLLFRRLVPVGGVAVLSCLLVMLAFRSGSASAQPAEIELASDDMGTYTFRDQKERMTMVWFYDRKDDSQFTQPSAVASLVPQ
jgi:anti-sigma factor RsiW